MDLLANLSKKSKVFMGIATALLLFLVIFSAVVYAQTLPPGNGETEIIIDIPMGTSAASVSTILEENDVIKNHLLFRLYLRQNGYGVQAGSYKMNDGLSYGELAEILATGQVHRESVRFTIPEGYKVEQIASSLEKQGLGDKEVFLDLVQNGEFDYWFIDEIPQNVDYRLEGYLFPNTYEVYEESTEWDVINTMLGQFNRTLSEEIQARAEEIGMTIHEALTLASIIEREAAVGHEREKISGVFHNRLSINMALQADATVQYLFEEQRDRVLYSDLRIDNPYNTYMYNGLPPGPIASPGKKSIEASVNPQNHEYYYYVTKKDGTGEHYFGKTYDEHKRFIQISNENRERNRNN